jgi:hypothetical protein
VTPLPGDRDLPPYDGVVTGYPDHTTPAGRCVDRRRPTVRIVHLGSGLRPTVSGVAADRGCRASDGRSARAGRIQRVQVTISREVGNGRCRFLISDGRLAPRSACSIPLAIVARGSRSWRVRPTDNAPAGNYTVRAAAIDRAGNVSAIDKRELRVH